MSYRMMTVKLACLLTLMMGSFAPAQQQKETTVGAPRADLDAIRKVSALLDADVMNRANEKIAGVEDLVLSPEGRMQYAVLSSGGIVGVGAKYTAIPWEALDVNFVDGKWAVNLDMTQEALEKAPRFEGDNYLELTNAEWVNRIHAFFRPRAEGADQPRQPLQVVLRATKITGATLKNAQDESIGQVKDLVLDREGRVAFAILGQGGVLNIGESYIAVPWSNLRLMYNKEDTAVSVRIDATKERLEKAPLVKGDSYANLLDPEFREYVYKYFGTTGADANANPPATERP